MAQTQHLSSLTNLLNGSKVTIFAEFEVDNPRKMYESFPRNVAKHFSGLFRDALPPTGCATVNRKGCDGKKVVTLYDCEWPALEIIFEWMLASCQGKEIAKIKFLPFMKIVRVFEAAKMLDVPEVVDSMRSRMHKIAASQIPIEELELFYAAGYPKTSEVRQLVVNSIGAAICERRLQKWGAYKKFKRLCGAYEADINDYLCRKHNMKMEMRKYQRTESRRQRRARIAQQNANTKPRTKTKTVSGVVARKRKGDRSSYAQMPPKEFNIPQWRYFAKGNGGNQKPQAPERAPAHDRYQIETEERLRSSRRAENDRAVLDM